MPYSSFYMLRATPAGALKAPTFYLRASPTFEGPVFWAALQQAASKQALKIILRENGTYDPLVILFIFYLLPIDNLGHALSSSQTNSAMLAAVEEGFGRDEGRCTGREQLHGEALRREGR